MGRDCDDSEMIANTDGIKHQGHRPSVGAPPSDARATPRSETYSTSRIDTPPGFLGKNPKTIKINPNPEMEGGIEPGSKNE